MSEAKRIADQLRRALEGDAWHGPNLRDLLAGSTAAQASKHPVEGAHSIGELVAHLTSWTAMARRRMAARKYVEMPEDENFPRFNGDWNASREALFTETRALAGEIEALPDEELTEFLYVLLHGSVQHHLYHAGQIALLRKLV